MKVQEIITEGATDILYHYTGTSSAARIFQDGAFKLSRTTGNPSEESYAPPGYPYFLSTSRSKVGDYHRWVGTGGVMFVLNGQWFGQRYPVKPIDYWERSWQHSPDRTREAEDRVFSKESEIPLDGVTAVHVLLKEQDESRSPLTRSILIEAKKLGIPTYLYTDEAAWRLQDTRKTVSVSQAGDLLSGPQSSGRMQRPMRGITDYDRNSMLDWIELIRKQPGQPLSKTADKLRYNIQYYGDMTGQLKNDLFNAKKPSANDYELAGKLVAYLTKNKITPDQLMAQLKEKWGSTQ